MNDQTRYLKQEVTRLQEEYKELKEEVVSLRSLLDSLNALMEAIDAIDPASAEIMPMLDRILYNALDVLDADAGSLLVLDEETQELVFVLAHGSVPRENSSSAAAGESQRASLISRASAVASAPVGSIA